MNCVCGHSDDLHEDMWDVFDINVDSEGDLIQAVCTVCNCNEFCEDIDEDELEIE